MSLCQCGILDFIGTGKVRQSWNTCSIVFNMFSMLFASNAVPSRDVDIEKRVLMARVEWSVHEQVFAAS